MRSNGSTRSSSAASRPRRCCPRPRPQPCCSGRCSPLVRSRCAKSTDGRASPTSSLTSRLTSLPDPISSANRRTRNQIPTQTATAPLGEPFHGTYRPYGFGRLRFVPLLELLRALAHVLVVALARKRLLVPVQELRGRIDLVVVLAFRKHRHLVEVFGEPRRRLRNMDKAVLDYSGLRIKTHDLVGGRLVAGENMAAVGDQLLDQLGARGLVLDQHLVRTEQAQLLPHGALECRILEPSAEHSEEKEVLAFHSPSCAHREVAELGCLVGGVPALHDTVEALRALVLAIALEPFRLDQAAAQRRGGLLILAGEVVFADRSPDTVEGIERLAVGVQGLALTAREASRFPDRLDLVLLVRLGDRWKAHHLPLLLPEDMADEIVFVQPLHDYDDGAVPLVIEPAVEGVVVPLVGGLPLRLGERLLRL